MKIRMEIKLGRRLANKLLQQGAAVKIDGKEFEVKGTIEELETKHPNFEIYYIGQFWKVAKED